MLVTEINPLFKPDRWERACSEVTEWSSSPVNPRQPDLRLSALHSPSQLCPHAFLHDLTLLKTRAAPSPAQPGCLPIHTRLSAAPCLQKPINCALAGQTHSARPKTRREEVIKFPHLRQTSKAPSSLAVRGSDAVAQSKMLELVNMSYNILTRPRGADAHRSWEGPGPERLPSWWTDCLNALFLFFFLRQHNWN